MKKQTKNYIIEHEDKYIHVPKLALLPILGTIFFSLLSYLNLKLIDWNIIRMVFEINDVETTQLPFEALINIYPIVGEYVLIALSLISLVAIFKQGYQELKPYDENGLIHFLIQGLILGLILGSFLGLIGHLAEAFIISLIIGLSVSLIANLMAASFFGLATELIVDD